MASYVPQYTLPLAELARARGVPPQKLTLGLGVQEMAIAPPWEDIVTMAANSGARLLRSVGVDPQEIGMLIVATETGVDHAKPVSIFVHELLGVGSACRVYELKHACYAGTAALAAAADWVRVGGAGRRRALVIAADIARYAVGSPAEPTQGAGAVAMLIGTEPSVLTLGECSGLYARQVYDFWRPLDQREAVVDGKFSVECYLEALTNAFGAYRLLAQPPPADGETMCDRLAALLYHTPFPKMAMKAHRRLLEIDWGVDARRLEAIQPRLEEAATASFQAMVAPGVEFIARVGNAYTASLYLCLAGQLEARGRMLAGRRIGLFSYGSGCCAEFFDGVVGADVEGALRSGLGDQLRARTVIDVPTYERLRLPDDAGGEPVGGFGGDFFFAGTRNSRRCYAKHEGHPHRTHHVAAEVALS